MLILNVVHEEAEQAIVLVQLDSPLFIMHHILKPKLIAKHVPLQALEQKHLATSQHAAPTRIRVVAGVHEALL